MLTFLLALPLLATQTSTPVNGELKPLTALQMKWWTDAKFGMFIHFGVYAIPAKGEWYMNNEHVSPADYRKLGEQFSPRQYDPALWVKIAQGAGMNYMVLTARHHDGFALWDSPSSYQDFTSAHMAAHRDLVKAYVDACRKARMRVGIYYSLMDWRIPGYYKPHELPESAQDLKSQCYGQVRELTHNYGPIDVLWYDGGWLNMTGSDADAAWLWEPVKLNQIVRDGNPQTLINPRSGWEGDFSCEEGGSEITGGIRKRPWEKCLNLNQESWGFNVKQNLMSLDQIELMLVNATVRDGNVLLNVGPDADGVIPPTHAARLKEVGDWLKKYGESVYRTRGGPIEPVDREYGTCYRGKTIYLHVLNAAPGNSLDLPPLGVHVLRTKVLTGGKAEFQQTDAGVSVQLSGLGTLGPDTIVRLDCDRPIQRSSP